MLATFILLLLLLSPFAGWLVLVVYRERLTLGEIYEKPRIVRLVYGLHAPLWICLVVLGSIWPIAMRLNMLLLAKSAGENLKLMEVQQAEAKAKYEKAVADAKANEPKSQGEVQHELDLKSLKADAGELEKQQEAYHATPAFQAKKAKADDLRRKADEAAQAGAAGVSKLKGLAEGAEGGLKDDTLTRRLRTAEAFKEVKENEIREDERRREARAIASVEPIKKPGERELTTEEKQGFKIVFLGFFLPQMLFMLAFFAALLSALSAWKRYKITAGIHGGARWAKWREIITSKSPRFLLPVYAAYSGTPRRWSLWERFFGTVGLNIVAQPEGDAVNSHFLVLGGTGAGKGFGVFNHVLASSKVPVIYQDVKGECPMIDHPKRQGSIRWGCAAEGGWASMRWNPLQECLNDANVYDSLKALAASLIPDNKEKGENAWIGQAARPVLAYILSRGKFTTLGSLADFLWEVPFPQLLEQVSEACEKDEEARRAVSRAPAGLMHQMEGKSVSNYVALEIQSQLDGFRVGWGREVTDGMDFTLDDLIQKGGYILSAETNEENRGPLKIMWALLIRRLMRSVDPRPCTILMDEALAAGKIPQILDSLLTLRNREVSIWMSFQSAAAVVKLYGKEEGKALMDAFGNRIVLLHGINQNDAKELSELVGQWSQKRETTFNFGVGMHGPHVGAQTGGNQETAIPLLPVTEIMSRSRSMDERWAVLSLREGAKKGNPIMCRLVGAENLSRKPTHEEIARDLKHWRVNPQTAAMPHALDQVPCHSCGRLNQMSHSVCGGCGAALGAHLPA